MVGGVCFLLLVSLTVETLLRGLRQYLQNMMPGGDIVALTLFLLFDMAVVVLLFAMIFRYLPDAKIEWRDVWVGATLTAVLFALGKFALGFYLEAVRRARRMERPVPLSLCSCGSTMPRKSFSLAQSLLSLREHVWRPRCADGACGKSRGNGESGNQLARDEPPSLFQQMRLLSEQDRASHEHR